MSRSVRAHDITSLLGLLIILLGLESTSLGFQPSYMDPAAWGHPIPTWPPEYQNPYVGDPIEATSGVFTLLEKDLFIPGRGQSLVFGRSYRSDMNISGPFGPGWDHTYNRYVLLDSSTPSVAKSYPGVARGVQYSLESQSGNVSHMVVAGTGQVLNITAPPGLAITGKLLNRDRDELNYSEAGALPGGQVVLELNEIRDAYGNALVLQYDASKRLDQVTGTTGVSWIRFEYLQFMGNDRVARVYDHTGREWLYEYYDSSSQHPGYLWKVTSPGTPDYPSGLTVEYSYDANGFLDAKKLPDGQFEFVNIYNSAGQVTQQSVPDGIATFEYTLPSQYGAFNRYTDPAGGITEYFTDVIAGHVVVTRLHEYREGNLLVPVVTLFEYDSFLNTTRIIFPDGIVVEMTYDHTNADARLRSNLLQEVVYPNDGGPPLRTEIDYEDAMVAAVRSPKTCAENDANSTAFNTFTDSFTYDPNGLLQERTRAYRTVSQFDGSQQTPTESWVYDVGATYRGQVVTYTDFNGVEIEFLYDSPLGQITQVQVDPTGQAISQHYQYDAQGAVSSYTDPEGRQTSFSVNERNQITGVTSAQSSVTYHYSPNDHLDRMSVPNDSPWGDGTTTREWLHDAHGRTLESWTDLDWDTQVGQRVTRQKFGYNGNGDVAHIYSLTGADFDPQIDGHVQLEYSSIGGVNQEIRFAASATSPDVVKEFDYDDMGRIVEERVGTLGGWTRARRVYDGYGRLQSVIDADDAYESYSYNENGAILETKRFDGQGNIVAWTKSAYDTLDRLKKTQQWYSSSAGTGTVTADGWITTKYLYDNAGRVVRVQPESGSGPKIEILYDVLGRVLEEADDLVSPQIFRTSYARDKTGLVLSVTKVNYSENLSLHADISQTTTYGRDASGRLTSITDSFGTSTLQYDIAGRLRRAVSEEGVISEWYYDEAGNLRVAATIDSDDGNWSNDPRSEYGYDTLGRKVSALIYDASLGNEMTQYFYDAAHRVTTVLYGDGTINSSIYDERGNLRRFTDAQGVVLDLQYGPRNLLASLEVSNAALGPTHQSWERDPLGRVTYSKSERMVAGQPQNDFSVEVNIQFNSLGLQESESLAITLPGSTTKNFSVYAAYDEHGRPDRLVYPSSNGTAYSYDSFGRLKQSWDQNDSELLQTLSYVGMNRVIQRIWPFSESLTTFGDHGRPVHRVHRTPIPGPLHQCIIPGQCRGSVHYTDFREMAVSAAGYDGDGRLAYLDRGTFDAEGHQVLQGSHVLGDVFRYNHRGELSAVFEDVSSPELYGQSDPTSYGRLVELEYEDRGDRQVRWHDGIASELYTNNLMGDLSSLNGVARSYDLNGGTTQIASSPSRTFGFDGLGQLVESVLGVASSQYIFDAFGRRVATIDPAGEQSFLVYWASDLVETYVVASLPDPVVSFYYDGTAAAPVAMRSAAEVGVQFLPQDLAGNIVGSYIDTLQDSGLLLEQYRVDSFGVPEVLTWDGSSFVSQANRQSSLGMQLLSFGDWVEPDPDLVLVGLSGNPFLPEQQRSLSRGPARQAMAGVAWESATTQRQVTIVAAQILKSNNSIVNPHGLLASNLHQTAGAGKTAPLDQNGCPRQFVPGRGVPKEGVHGCGGCPVPDGFNPWCPYTSDSQIELNLSEADRDRIREHIENGETEAAAKILAEKFADVALDLTPIIGSIKAILESQDVKDLAVAGGLLFIDFATLGMGGTGFRVAIRFAAGGEIVRLVGRAAKFVNDATGKPLRAVVTVGADAAIAIGRAIRSLFGRIRGWFAGSGKAARGGARQVTIESAHGARHLAGTGLKSGTVESAITKSVQTATEGASETGSFWGRVTVEGQVIEYRAFTLPNGTINVGTYYPVVP